jgi:hypothetical protein
MAALTVGRRAAHHLQSKRHLLRGQPCGDPDVSERAEVVGVGDEGVSLGDGTSWLSRLVS